MSSFYYIVHIDEDRPAVTFKSLREVFSLIKSEGLISIYQHNNKTTDHAYAKAADKACLSAKEREQRPILITTALDEDGVFVESEDFWIENYMIDEFYNPDTFPYIEKLL